jgi:hypothetical protein
MNDDKIEKIQIELKQLSRRRLEIVEAHHEKAKANQARVNAHEQAKTLYHRVFGQPPLPPDPDLLPNPVLHVLDSEISHLKARELEYIKILQVRQLKNSQELVLPFRMPLLPQSHSLKTIGQSLAFILTL